MLTGARQEKEIGTLTGSAVGGMAGTAVEECGREEELLKEAWLPSSSPSVPRENAHPGCSISQFSQRHRKY